MRQIGRVIWFDPKKGYGFVEQNSGADVFVHFSQIVFPHVSTDDKFKKLNPGDTVEFDIEVVRERPQAVNVNILARSGGGKNEILSQRKDNAVKG